MTPGISEFSYGFALTNELVSLADISAAPIFPSLIEEGQEGGGYDVHLQTPGLPIFLQFKRSEHMSRRSAREFRDHGFPDVPYHRFAVTDRHLSRQHEMLIERNQTHRHVYYVAPRFHSLEELNASWLARTVAADSIFVRPSEIGVLDDGPHNVAFRGQNAWVFSKPKFVGSHGINELIGEIQADLAGETRPLTDVVKEHLRETRETIAIVRDRRARAHRMDVDELAFTEAPLPLSKGIQPALTPNKAVPASIRDLTDLADIAMMELGAQLIVFQANAD